GLDQLPAVVGLPNGGFVVACNNGSGGGFIHLGFCDAANNLIASQPAAAEPPRTTSSPSATPLPCTAATSVSFRPPPRNTLRDLTQREKKYATGLSYHLCKRPRDLLSRRRRDTRQQLFARSFPQRHRRLLRASDGRPVFCSFLCRRSPCRQLNRL